MEITSFRNNIRFIPQVAMYMFEEWGTITVEAYINVLYRRLSIDKIPLTIIAKSGDDLMGFASLVEFAMEGHKDLTPWVEGVFVTQKYRGQGVGNSLVKGIENISKKLGYHQIYLFTDKEKFYSKLSWYKIMDDKYLGKDVVIMKRDI